MQVSVESLQGLERKITVSVPSQKVEEEVSLRLRNLARKVKMDGFRQGKVPLDLVNKRYSHDVRNEVTREMVQSTLFEALKEKDLVPAGMPEVEPLQIEEGKDFEYSAKFEVLPEIKINELNKAEVESVHAEVKDKDVNDMIEKLREQNKNWKEVDRAAKDADKVVIDFEGFVDDKAFQGGAAKGHELILGSKSMIPGFEEGIIGHKKEKAFDINVEFPADYGHAELAGKKSVFKITIHAIFEGVLPALDDEFAAKFNLKEKGMDALKKDIKENMERELERRVSSMNREKAFDKLLELNPIDLPNTMVDSEIGHLKHEMYHRLFGNEHSDNEQIPDFPRELFEEQAKRRVHLGLLFSEYVKLHKLTADKARVDAMIDKLASAYEHPEELKAWYQGNKEHLAEIEALVTEEVVAEKINENAKVVKKAMSYDEVMNPQKDKKEAKATKESKKSSKAKGE